MKRSQQNASEIKIKSSSSLDEKRAVRLYERQSAIDESEIESTYQEKTMYLCLAVQNYMFNLLNSDKSSDEVFRFVSLWLKNRNNKDIGDLIKNQLTNIPTYKFIPILPQLIPHISLKPEDIFSKEITLLLKNCALDHPHHTLPLLFSLANSNKDEEYTKTKSCTENNEPRVLAANFLIENFKEMQKLTDIVNKFKLFCDALIELAYVQQGDCKKIDQKISKYKINSNAKILEIVNFEEISLPTLQIPVRRNCSYTKVVGVQSFQNYFFGVGGINAPKRITCIGTDGISRSLLVKGKDDLRQDAVMQQVFTFINSLLAANKKTTNLLIRTYKVLL